MSGADEYVWDWPPVPEVAGRRDALSFPPIVLRTGDTLRIRQEVGPFGLTVLGAEREAKEASA